MIFVLLLMFCICVYKMELPKTGNYHKDYISVEKTTSIKGIFILCVFSSHFIPYVELNNSYLNMPFQLIFNLLGQLMVTMFLFYSGYGVLESIKIKRTEYVNKMPINRILRVLITFDMAILLFLILNLFLGRSYDISTIVVSFLAWKSVGNSTWYIFAILLTYLFTFFSFKMFKKNYVAAVSCVTVFSIIFIIVMSNFKEPFWYNTILCYAAGMWFSLYRKQIESIVLSNNLRYLLWLFAFVLLFVFMYLFRDNMVIYQLLSVLFVGIVVLITMKVSFNNVILNWFGVHLFSIYILQRLPMILFSHMGLNSYNLYLYFVLCLVVTLIIAPVFDKFTNKIFIGVPNKNVNVKA